MKQETNNEQQRLAQLAIDLSEIFGVTEPIHTFVEAVDRLNIILHAEAFDQLAQQAFHDPHYHIRSMEDLMRANGKTDLPFEQFLVQALRQAKEEQEKADATDALPRLQGLNTVSHTSPNNRLANILPKGLTETCQNTGPVNLVVAHRGKKNQITTYTTILYLPEDDKLKMKWSSFTAYDREVYDAIVSIYLEFQRQAITPVVFTPAMVYRAMTGKTDTETPSLQSFHSIVQSIEKMRFLKAYVNATDEITAYRKSKGQTIKPGSVFKWDDFILSVRGLDVKAGKETVQGYLLKEEPLLYSYALSTGQVLTLPTSLLDIKQVTKEGQVTPVSLLNNDNRIVVKSYLWRRIAVMKRDWKNKSHKQSHVILFESLFEETGQAGADKKALRRTRDYVLQVLDYWKAAKFIKDYSLQMKGRSVIGVRIHF